jgi:hypothetical protein
MNHQEHEEQARKLEAFHDKHHYVQPPEWLRKEAEAETTAKLQATDTTPTYDVGRYTAQVDERGTLVLAGAGKRITLSADEAYKLLVVLHDTHRALLHKLTHEDQRPE